MIGRLRLMLCLLLQALLMATVAGAVVDYQAAGSVDLVAKRDAMRIMLARGAAIEAIRQGDAALGGLQGKGTSPVTAEIFQLQMQAYLRLGLPQVAMKMIGERLAVLPPENASEMPQLLAVFGQAAIAGGRIEEAEQALDQVLANAKTVAGSDKVWPLLLKANVRYLQRKNADAMKLCREAEALTAQTTDATLKGLVQLQRAQIARQSGDLQQATAAYIAAIVNYKEAGDTHDAVYGNIAAASGLVRMTAVKPDERAENLAAATATLSNAVEAAQRISDHRALSLGLGKLGEMFAVDGKLDQALAATLRALHQAQLERFGDLVYRWQHQAGSILKKQKNSAKALDMYRLAAQNLNLFKKGLANDCGIADGSFQETTKPVYLDLAELLIDTSVQAGDHQEKQKLLREAQATIEALRTEELRDYFEDACLGAEKGVKAVLVNIPPKTALIYTIMLPERTELLVTLPDGIKRFKATETSAVIGREIRLLRMSIENRFPAWVTSARKLYDWLVRPIEADLKKQEVNTIVFVPDGPLRNIPLTVLNDGKANIIDTYAIATIQSLGFTTPPGAGKPGTMMLAGISESVQGYPALTNVIQEEQGIRSSFPGVSLINSEFRVQKLEAQLNLIPYPLIHIASHGEFTGNSRNNYVLTWDGKLTLNDLDRFIKQSVIRKTPVEVISLSACKTAAGDDRAALGLAGLAVKSGARTAVASLWDIDDKSTAELFIEFYRIVKERGSIGRAEALRQAQLEVRKRYDHPYFWSPFLLIGNWL